MGLYLKIITMRLTTNSQNTYMQRKVLTIYRQTPQKLILLTNASGIEFKRHKCDFLGTKSLHSELPSQ